MLIDTVLLSRIQFGFTIGFHILFPTLNIGLALFLCVMEGVWLKTKNSVYYDICRFWTKVFALTFVMGVVSGVVMSYELGTNFGHFTEAIGAVLGSLFAYEVLSAFFLEAGFLGIMLFGWNRLPPLVHFGATLMVTIGTTISAFWILSANSWMQTPDGFQIIAGKYVVTSWWHAVFNPSFLPRFFHMVLASYVTVSFVIAGVSAWYLLRKEHVEVAKKCFSIAMGVAVFLTLLQIDIGDKVGLEVFKNQPLKTAAMEGVWQTGNGLPFVIFGIPDEKTESNLYAITVPYVASILNTHHIDGRLIGLTSVPLGDRPVVDAVFFAFRVMVGIGTLLFFIAAYGLYLRFRGRLFSHPFFYRVCILAAPLGFISTICGWVTAESGRQPWVVYHLIRTVDGASVVPATHVAISLLLFICAYGTVLSFYLYYLFKLLRKGPVCY